MREQTGRQTKPQLKTTPPLCRSTEAIGSTSRSTIPNCDSSREKAMARKIRAVALLCWASWIGRRWSERVYHSASLDEDSRPAQVTPSPRHPRSSSHFGRLMRLEQGILHKSGGGVHCVPLFLAALSHFGHLLSSSSSSAASKRRQRQANKQQLKAVKVANKRARWRSPSGQWRCLGAELETHLAHLRGCDDATRAQARPTWAEVECTPG